MEKPLWNRAGWLVVCYRELEGESVAGEGKAFISEMAYYRLGEKNEAIERVQSMAKAVPFGVVTLSQVDSPCLSMEKRLHTTDHGQKYSARDPEDGNPWDREGVEQCTAVVRGPDCWLVKPWGGVEPVKTISRHTGRPVEEFEAFAVPYGMPNKEAVDYATRGRLSRLYPITKTAKRLAKEFAKEGDRE